MPSEPRTLCDIFRRRGGQREARPPDLEGGGEWPPISAADFGFTVRALSLGLNALGIQPGDRVAILSENRPEWAMADYAVLCGGAWSVPIYPTLPAAQIAPLLNDSGAQAIFVSTPRTARQDPDDPGAVPGARPRHPHRRRSAGRAGLRDLHEVVDRGRPTSR